MQDPANELRRINLPRTPVNRASKDAPSFTGWHHALVVEVLPARVKQEEGDAQHAALHDAVHLRR
jgi:hypothetical protein